MVAGQGRRSGNIAHTLPAYKTRTKHGRRSGNITHTLPAYKTSMVANIHTQDPHEETPMQVWNLPCYHELEKAGVSQTC